MLAIRMQRTGRKGHAQFRVVVQDSRLTPTSGRVVAQLGSYNPHAKTIILDKEKASFYLQHGAQPSDRVARLLQKEGVDMPKWVTTLDDKVRVIRNPEKLRKNQPAQEVKEEVAPVAEPISEPISEAVTETEAEEAVATTKPPEVVAEAPAETKSEDVAETPTVEKPSVELPTDVTPPEEAKQAPKA